MNQSTAGRNGPSHRNGPADENGTISTTNQPNSPNYTGARRVYAQESFPDLGITDDDGSAVGS
jgi:hypothetical protein